jgi:hypothetical protein
MRELKSYQMQACCHPTSQDAKPWGWWIWFDLVFSYLIRWLYLTIQCVFLFKCVRLRCSNARPSFVTEWQRRIFLVRTNLEAHCIVKF